MWETLQADPEITGAVLITIIIASAILAGIWMKTWRKNEAGKRDAEIKLEMLARGMSADDIERVLAAKSDGVKLDETMPCKK